MTSPNLMFGSTTQSPVSANLFCESKDENFLMPVQESQDSIDDMVRTHITSKSRDGGSVIDGRDSFSGHMGKGISSFSGGYAGKGQIKSVNQLGMFGVGSVGTVEHVAKTVGVLIYYV